uniref:Uncharacterized protein n=1 Tax=Triticum urartu TaxID=4572 RepID=A0A8R7UXN4_TRIUA
MIVINVSFSLTITVFGLERALAKRTIVVFGGTYLKNQSCLPGLSLCTLSHCI